MEQWAFWLATTGITTLIAIIAYYFKKTAQATAETMKDLGTRIDKLEEKLHETIAKLPFEYTLREDFIRSMSGVEAKLNKILDRLPPKGE